MGILGPMVLGKLEKKVTMQGPCDFGHMVFSTLFSLLTFELDFHFDNFFLLNISDGH